MHSDFCDGKSRVEDYAIVAEQKGVVSVGYSSHAPLPFSTKWAMPADSLPVYVARIDNIRRSHPTFEVYTGLEVDFIPGRIGPGSFRQQLDYTIGSIHFADPDPKGEYLEIDGPHATFLSQLQNIYDFEIRAAVTRYLELTREMLVSDCPDVLGHMDKIKIQNPGNILFNEGETWYRREVGLTVDAICASGVIVEVNTRGVYQGKSETTYPAPWILEKLYERRVPITLSSDAHHPSDMINYFPEAAALLRRVGFRELMCLRNGRWQPLAFDEHGIKA